MVEVLIGIISGTISGTGMGGGTILIFLLTVLCRLEQHIAQATNLIFFIPTSIVAIIVNIKNKNIDLIKFKTIKKYQDGKIERICGPIFEVSAGEEAFNKLYSKDILIEPSWLYLYRRECRRVRRHLCRKQC